MKKSTLCFCVRDGQVLLAMKKRGFGSGKWNGYGGKVQENEIPIMAAVRELEEESGLVADFKDLQQAAVVRFYFDGNPVSECSVYQTHIWKNEPIETEEMRPQWYPISDLPFGEMWAADAKWIPLILSGEKIEAEINFNTDGSVVKEFSYKPAVFN
ncbi:MAG: 8-oxo-dGTP diphosphatase [Patescibacteria group bacterium]